jgi:hypothetical protein
LMNAGRQQKKPYIPQDYIRRTSNQLLSWREAHSLFCLCVLIIQVTVFLIFFTVLPNLINLSVITVTVACI